MPRGIAEQRLPFIVGHRRIAFPILGKLLSKGIGLTT
jgi:hypothetical protein